jgi:hypothetical protein
MNEYTIVKYKEALEAIAGASDQANPIHLKVVAQTALDFEETTADEFNDEEKKEYKYPKKQSMTSCIGYRGEE